MKRSSSEIDEFEQAAAIAQSELLDTTARLARTAADYLSATVAETQAAALAATTAAELLATLVAQTTAATLAATQAGDSFLLLLANLW